MITKNETSMLMWLGFILIVMLAYFLNGCSTLQKNTDAARDYLVTCGKLKSVSDAKYCIHFRANEAQTQTLFYLHGLLDSESVLSTSFFNQESLKTMAEGLHGTTIVTISFGMSWMLTTYPNRWRNPKDATVEALKTKVLPELSGKFPLPKPWAIVGHSQGGANAATVCLNMPDEFGFCGLVNPMLLNCNPFNFFDFGCLAAPVIRAHYSQKEWNEYGQDAMLEGATRLPKTYVTACADDKFKLYAGAKDWATKAHLKGFPVEFEDGVPGCDHQKWNTKKIIDIMSQTNKAPAQ